jgi:hypothetical protein
MDRRSSTESDKWQQLCGSNIAEREGLNNFKSIVVSRDANDGSLVNNDTILYMNRCGTISHLHTVRASALLNINNANQMPVRSDRPIKQNNGVGVEIFLFTDVPASTCRDWR